MVHHIKLALELRRTAYRVQPLLTKLGALPPGQVAGPPATAQVVRDQFAHIRAQRRHVALAKMLLVKAVKAAAPVHVDIVAGQRLLRRIPVARAEQAQTELPHWHTYEFGQTWRLIEDRQVDIVPQ